MTKPSAEHEKAFEEILKMNPEEAQQKPEAVGEHPGTKIHESEMNFSISRAELEGST
jgi:hypothetical protein